MKRHTLALICLTVSFVALVGVYAGITPPPEYDITRQNFGAGGVAKGGNYEIAYTVGLPAVAPSAGGDYDFTAGSWFESPPGDCALDGVVSLADYSEMSPCLAGPDDPILDNFCTCFDTDTNGRVDLKDFALFQQTFTGD